MDVENITFHFSEINIAWAPCTGNISNHDELLYL